MVKVWRVIAARRIARIIKICSIKANVIVVISMASGVVCMYMMIGNLQQMLFPIIVKHELPLLVHALVQPLIVCYITFLLHV